MRPQIKATPVKRSPLIPGACRTYKICRGHLRRPNGHRVSALNLDSQGGQLVLVSVILVRNEFKGPEDGHHVSIS